MRIEKLGGLNWWAKERGEKGAAEKRWEGAS